MGTDKFRSLTIPSNDDEFQTPPTFDSSCSKAWWKPEELPSYPHQGSEVDEEADSIIKMDSPEPKATFAGFSADEDDELDDEESSFESEEDSFEERWIPTDEGLETSVLRATGNNLSLAARLIPPLHEMFQQEKSSVVGFWEPCYRQKAGNSYDQDSGEQGYGGNLLVAILTGMQIIERDRGKMMKRMTKGLKTTRTEIRMVTRGATKVPVVEVPIPVFLHGRSTKGIHQCTMGFTDLQAQGKGSTKLASQDLTPNNVSGNLSFPNFRDPTLIKSENTWTAYIDAFNAKNVLGNLRHHKNNEKWTSKSICQTENAAMLHLLSSKVLLSCNGLRFKHCRAGVDPHLAAANPNLP